MCIMPDILLVIIISLMIIKFCVVGEPAVGKTSMLCQYIHKKFDEKVRPTIGCDFTTKLKSSVDGSPIRLQLWDIAGQEKFNAVSKMYLRGALGCVIVCSADEQKTLQETLKWKRIIQENSDFGLEPAVPCMLVQNKSDIVSGEDPEPFQQLAYLQDFANENGFCGAIQTSAKKNQNIEEVFQTLLDETLKRGLVNTKGTMQKPSRQHHQPVILAKQNIPRKPKQMRKCC